MKPITSSFLITLSLSLLLHPCIGTASSNLIEEVCARSHNKDNCVASIESNPDSKNATLKQLGIIALTLASANATNTSQYIKTTLLNKSPDLDPSVEQALADCSDQYLDAVQLLDDAMPALLADGSNEVSAWVSAAIVDAESCENGFKGNSAGSDILLSRNAMFRQLCNNVLIIAKLLAQQ